MAATYMPQQKKWVAHNDDGLIFQVGFKYLDSGMVQVTLIKGLTDPETFNVGFAVNAALAEKKARAYIKAEKLRQLIIKLSKE